MAVKAKNFIHHDAWLCHRLIAEINFFMAVGMPKSPACCGLYHSAFSSIAKCSCRSASTWKHSASSCQVKWVKLCEICARCCTCLRLKLWHSCSKACASSMTGKHHSPPQSPVLGRCCHNHWSAHCSTKTYADLTGTAFFGFLKGNSCSKPCWCALQCCCIGQ